MHIIDRRFNPKDKSLANRQRFLRRARRQVMEAVRDASSKRRIADIAGGEQVTIPSDGLREPSLRKSADKGVQHHVVPGNKEFVVGDRIAKPEGGGGGGGSEGSPDGEGQDDFRFVISRDEFLDLFFEDLELPDLVKKQLRKSEKFALERRGYAVTGSPSNLNLVRTMRNSLARRIALKRPKSEEIEELDREIDRLERSGKDPARLRGLIDRRSEMLQRIKAVPYIDPVDVRYNRFEWSPRPVSQAVMFCLMDVSGSMTEHMKDLAKRFFMLLYLFLERRYRYVDIVFIRHTHIAQEVDEDTFFYSRETGGTLVSPALAEMKRVIDDRYPPADWNIYAAQASDGDNTLSDNPDAAAALEHEILPLCQYFAYIEVGAQPTHFLRRETELWRTYETVAGPDRPLVMRRVKSRNDIFPVFRELFSKNQAGATA